MKEIKVIIKNNLLEERKRRLEESLTSLNSIEDKNVLLEKFLITTSRLIDDGYSIQEIEASDVYNKLNSVDWKGVVGDTILTSAKEYIIKYVMQVVLGANPTFSRMFAQFMANVNPLDLLKPFKDQQSCIQSFPQISDGILIVMFRSIAGGEIGVDSNSYQLGMKDGLSVIAGNMVGKAIKESNVSEKVADMFCKAVH
jgi:hypothetical protein